MKTIIASIIIAAAVFSHATPAEDRDWATRIPCELQTAGAQSLPPLTFQQGTLPLLSLDQYRSGRAVDAVTNGTVEAVFTFGPSATSQYFVAVTNYASVSNGYLVQLPTVGTNTANTAWWYTAYFTRSGKRYWTGNGRLNILATTSTADGLVWQEITSGAQVDPIAQPVASNALAAAQAAQSTANSANVAATNAAAIAAVGSSHAGITNANPHGTTAAQIGALTAEADTLATVTARGATTTSAVTIGSRGDGAVGVSSFANGYNVVASGFFSHAEGVGTTASGYYSHAEGSDTTASRDFSHAEGGGTTASGDNSHAEGSGTIASGDSSHAEGVSTTASRDFSHAEGGGTTASGDNSHAEGGGTTASGDNSHAEGLRTTASGEASHAEGLGTTASGDSSHAEGGGTTASGDNSHASGFNAVASHITAFAWQGSSGDLTEPEYYSHGNGTYNINPVGGTGGFWIGETTLAALLAAKANAETVVTGAVGTASAGNRYFWTTATNVTLSVNLSAGQVINYAQLNNTATNAITAIAETSDWRWRGSAMTNSIPAGRAMTFGWSVDPNDGKTNFYATAASEN